MNALRVPSGRHVRSMPGLRLGSLQAQRLQSVVRPILNTPFCDGDHSGTGPPVSNAVRYVGLGWL
jgi:hypothetical protein